MIELKEKAKEIIATFEDMPNVIYGVVRDYMIENGELDTEDADLDITPNEKYVEIEMMLPDTCATATEVRYNEMTGDIELVVEDDRERVNFYDLSTYEKVELLKELF